MDKTWMPLVAGILDIVAGALTLIGGIIYFIVGGLFFAMLSGNISAGEEFLAFLPVIFMFFAALGIIIGILAVIGGIFALRNKIWGLALAGSIAAIIPFWPLGIASIVFTALSKDEFE